MRPLRSRLLPSVLLAGVLGLDALIARVPFSVPVVGALDEPAHLATALLVLLALPARGALRRRPLVLAALAGSVLIDLDHLPLYAGLPGWAADGGRPVTHSLLTVAVLLAAAALRPRRHDLAAGAALGVGLHVLRDLATGPGVSLLWPVLDRAVLLPYPLYAAVLLGLTVAAVRRARPGAPPAGRPLLAARRR